MISDSSIDELKARINIVDVISEKVKLKKSGSDYVGLCPFHDEKTPSFHVHPAKCIYKCFGCGKSGDAIQFVIENDRVTYPEAVQQLADKYSIVLGSDAKKEYVRPQERLQKVDDKILKFFESRGISNNTLLYFKVTQSIEWMPQFQKETPVICFNYYREGQLINIKFRGAQKRFKLAKDAELIFYNLDAVKESEVVIITEGEMDCLSVFEAGYLDCISVPNGAEAKNLQYLDNCFSYFENKKAILIMTDNDAPGRALKEELARRLGYERCKFVVYPSDCKDANDVLTKYGKEKLKSVIESAVEFPIEGVEYVFDMADKIYDYYENGYPNGYVVPLPGYKDNVDIQWMLGQFMAVTGVPGSGKSEYIDWAMIAMSIHHGWKWVIWSPENQPPAVHITKLMQKYCGKAFGFRKDLNDRIPKEKIAPAIEFLNNHFFFIKVDEVSATLDDILKKVEDLVLRKGIHGFLLDPWNKLIKDWGKFSETEMTNIALTKITAFSKKRGIFSIAVAHPTKMPKEKKADGKNSLNYEIPTMYNISGSSNWYNQIDLGMTVYRDREAGIIKVLWQKVRFDWLGREGYIDYRFNTMTRQYELDIGSPRELPNTENYKNYYEVENDEEETPF